MKLRTHCAWLCLALSALSGCTNLTTENTNPQWYSYQELMKLQDQNESLQNIQKLNLSEIQNDIDLSKLSGLKELSVSNSDWSKIHNIPNGLTILDVENVTHFALPADLRNLQKLAIHDCANFTLNLPLSETYLFLDICQNVSLPDIPNSLQELRIVDTTFTQMTILNLEAAHQLKKLILHGGNHLLISGNIPQNLTEISILNNAMRYNVFDISKAVHLQKVAITNVVDIKLGNNADLKEMQIFDSKNTHISGTLPQSLECLEVRDTSFRKGEKLRVSKNTEVSLDGCKNLTVLRN